MALLISIALAFVGLFHAALTHLRRWLTLRYGNLPIETVFEPTAWDAHHGVVALLPDKLPEFLDSEAFRPPSSWLMDGAFLTETNFMLTIESTSTDSFSRPVVITEIVANIERVAIQDQGGGEERVLLRWTPLPVGGDWTEIDDPEHPRILPRVVHVRELPEKPVMLMHGMQGHVPPPGGYRLRAGSRFVFVFRFEFETAGEYQVRLRLVASESHREQQPELVTGLRLLQLETVEKLPHEIVTLQGDSVDGRPPPDQVAEVVRHLALARERVQRATSSPSPTDPDPVVVVPYDPSRRALPGDYGWR